MMTEESGAKALYLSIRSGGVLLSLLTQADETKDVILLVAPDMAVCDWWPLTWLPLIGGPRFARRSDYTL